MVEVAEKAPASRREALSVGARRYFTGKPCRNGHVAERYVGNSWCVVCTKENEKRYRERNPERAKARFKKYYNKPENKEKLRKRHLSDNYNMTEEQYNELFERQNGVCAICSGESWGNSRLHVDHCHSTNEVRGLLCSKCNHALGLFQDSEDIMRNAIRYLKNNGRTDG